MAQKGVGRTPAAEGFRLPAEWEPHEATWIGWPHNLTDWPGKFAPVPWVYAEIVRKITPGEMVRILVNTRAHEARARRVLARVGVDLSRVEFFRFSTNRGWTRDFGPMFVKRDRPRPVPDGTGPRHEDSRQQIPRPGIAIVGFGFNGWAKYPDWQRDNQVPTRAARVLRRRFFLPKV